MKFTPFHRGVNLNGQIVIGSGRQDGQICFSSQVKWLSSRGQELPGDPIVPECIGGQIHLDRAVRSQEYTHLALILLREGEIRPLDHQRREFLTQGLPGWMRPAKIIGHAHAALVGPEDGRRGAGGRQAGFVWVGENHEIFIVRLSHVFEKGLDIYLRHTMAIN